MVVFCLVCGFYVLLRLCYVELLCLLEEYETLPALPATYHGEGLKVSEGASRSNTQIFITPKIISTIIICD